MPRRRAVSSLTPLVLLATLALAACGLERAPDDRLHRRDPVVEAGPPATGGVRTAGGEVDTTTAVPTAAAAPDTAPTVAPLPAPAATRAERDSAPPVATAAELAELRAGLVVPVQGVLPAQLRDAYAEARGSRVHEALDVMAPRGTPVLSAADGELLRLHRSVAGGNMIYAADASGRFLLLYAHLDRWADGLREGMPLRRGQLVGYVGTTGNAAPNAPHLHFAVMRARPRVSWWRGTPVNPFPLLAP